MPHRSSERNHTENAITLPKAIWSERRPVLGHFDLIGPQEAARLRWACEVADALDRAVILADGLRILDARPPAQG